MGSCGGSIVMDLPDFDPNPPAHLEPETRRSRRVQWPDLPPEAELDLDAACEQLDADASHRAELAIQTIVLWRRHLITDAEAWSIAGRIERAETEGERQCGDVQQLARARAT
jgi:hypothetical protein